MPLINLHKMNKENNLIILQSGLLTMVKKNKSGFFLLNVHDSVVFFCSFREIIVRKKCLCKQKLHRQLQVGQLSASAK